MNESSLTVSKERIPVLQRLIPSISFGLTALSGILGSLWILQLFRKLRDDERASAKALMSELGSIEQSVVMILLLAAIIGAISIVVVFMISNEDEATMPGIAYLVGLPCLFSPALLTYSIYLVVDVFHKPLTGDLAKLGGDVAELAILSILSGVIALVVLLPFAFLPFKARVGKRIAPAIVIGIFTCGIVVLVAMSFWLIGYSQEPTVSFGPA